MMDNPSLVLLLGIGIGTLLTFTLVILIYAYWDLSRKFKELFKEIKGCVKRDNGE